MNIFHFSGGVISSDIVPIYESGVVSYNLPARYMDGIIGYGDEVLDFVTYRTAEDVQRVKDIKEKIVAGTATPTERAEFLAGMIGYYGASDMNRVESNVSKIAQFFIDIKAYVENFSKISEVELEYDLVPHFNPSVLSVTVKTDWKMADIPTNAHSVRYANNAKVFRKTDINFVRTAVPSSLDKLTFNSANAIEQELKNAYEAAIQFRNAAETAIVSAKSNYIFSGEIYGGEYQ